MLEHLGNRPRLKLAVPYVHFTKFLPLDSNHSWAYFGIIITWMHSVQEIWRWSTALPRLGGAEFHPRHVRRTCWFAIDSMFQYTMIASFTIFNCHNFLTPNEEVRMFLLDPLKARCSRGGQLHVHKTIQPDFNDNIQCYLDSDAPVPRAIFTTWGPGGS